MTQATLDFPDQWTLKCCTKCGKTKATSEFYASKGRLRQPCKECAKADRKRWRDENPDLLRERQVGYRLKFYFGIDREEYESRLADQDGGCAICGRSNVGRWGTLHVDHCHATGTVRGLLCWQCNSGLGAFGEDTALMERAATYLEASA